MPCQANALVKSVGGEFPGKFLGATISNIDVDASAAILNWSTHLANYFPHYPLKPRSMTLALNEYFP